MTGGSMAKMINPDKLTLGIRKEFKKDVPNSGNDIENLVQKIHAVPVAKGEETRRFTLDIPKDLHKKISRHALDKDLTLRAYFIELAKKDLGIE
jgi:hypothetical protein